MNLKLLLVLLVLSLAGCGMRSAKGDLPVSDLDVLAQNVKEDLKPTVLPNGKIYCAEESITEEDKDRCTGDLEDGLFTSNKDKVRASKTLDRGIARLKLLRNPCGFWEKLFRADRCTVD